MAQTRARVAARPVTPKGLSARKGPATLTAAGALLVAALLQIGSWPVAAPEAAAARKRGESLNLTADQMQQLTVAKVELHPFRIERTAVGQIGLNEDATTLVLPPFSGRATRLVAKIGDTVKRGAPLLEIDSPEVVQPQSDLIAAATAMNKARSQLNLAQISEQRDRTLYEGSAGTLKAWQQSQAQLDEARNNMRAAETAVAAARHRLQILGLSDDDITALQEKGTIRRAIPIHAPIDGVVIARKVGPGQYVRSDAGEPLYTIADVSTMWLKAFVPEMDIPFIRVGQQVEVRVTAIPDRVFTARITYIGAAFEATTRRMIVRSEVPNPGGALKAEMFATFKILTGESAPKPAVPMDAVIREGDLAAVFVQQAPMSFQRRMVRIGLEQDGRVQVLDGIGPDEVVVARGAIFLENEWQQ
jgi:cobalt-zinc-cadmium efflux system membrane fusion protein